MYMSYCRHEGTLSELRACLDDVNQHVCEEAEYSVSEREIGKFKEMVETFYEWICDMGLVNEYGELNQDELEGICEYMRKGTNDDF